MGTFIFIVIFLLIGYWLAGGIGILLSGILLALLCLCFGHDY